MKLMNMPKQITLLFLIFSIQSIVIFAQENKNFSSIEEVLAVVKNKNNTLKNAKFQINIADIGLRAAIGNSINPRVSTSIQTVNNINQQVSFLPGQAFGLPQGTFKEVTIGQQFVSTFSIQPQFDILNLGNIAAIKTAKINKQLAANQNKINEQNLFEQINAVYFNILSFNAQKEILIENIKIAEQIKQITKNKFKEGIARKQELNEAEVNLIALQDKLEQVVSNTNIQYEILNLFFENEYNITLIENIWQYEKTARMLQTQNNLPIVNAILQCKLAQQEYKTLKYQNLPVLSFVSSFNWQNLSNEKFFAKKSYWINYDYVGLKLTYDLPTTVQKYANLKNKNVQINLLKNTETHIIKENESRNKQMILAYEKALSQKNNMLKIYDLKKDTYEKNFNQFIENLLPLDKLLIAQTDMMNSKFNVVLTLANIGFSKTKIEINNGF